MKSKHLIEQTRVLEADDSNTPPGVTTGGGPPRPGDFGAEERTRPRGVRAGSLHSAEDMKHRARGDTDLLRDALLFVLASGNELDKGIVLKLLGGKTPDPGEIQHILDEAGRYYNELPGYLQKGLGAIHQKMAGGV